MIRIVESALSLWGLRDARHEFVAGRENQVFRVQCPEGDFALRIKRPGYRAEDELVSELEWLAAMEAAGLHVPRPRPSLNGKHLESVEGFFVDMISWLPGRPLGKSRVPLDLEDRQAVFSALGVEMARLHDACDQWQRPANFRRCNWNIEGLLGDNPVWGRFWDNPTLSAERRDLFIRFRQFARDRLHALQSGLDHGLIHADLVRENVLLDGETIALIDFDDGGFGYRQFDVATLLLKNMAEPDYPALKAALIDGYESQRKLDLSSLDLFVVLRALSYVGWIATRMEEPGGEQRNARFVSEAETLCGLFLRQNE